MTNTPRFTPPVSSGGEHEKVPEETPQIRPTTEKVTPSQQGQFRGALERKTEKKEAKKTGEAAAEKTEEGGGIFQLAATRKTQGEGGGSEMETGEEAGGEAGQGFLPKKKASTEPSQEQVVAAGQMAAGQARVVSQATTPVGPSQLSVSKLAPTAGPKTGAPVHGEGRPGFQKLVGEAEPKTQGGKKGAETTVPPPVVGEQKPIITPTLASQTETPTTSSQAQRTAMIQLITQAAEALATFVSKEVTSTVVTIRQPPIFEGATLMVTEHSAAPRQFNITFGNLSPEARRMVESVANQQQLKQALVDRGYTVQNIVIESTPRKVELPTVSGTAAERKPGEGYEEAGGEGAGEGAEGTK